METDHQSDDTSITDASQANPQPLYSRFSDPDGVEVIACGGAHRQQLAHEVIAQKSTLSAAAVHLLQAFMKDQGAFELSSVDVFEFSTPETGDFSVRFFFVADRDPAEYNYTYFDVFFQCHPPPQKPYWPFKFTVGFH